MAEREDPAAHDQRELARLHRFLTRSELDFGLALAVFADPVVARKMREQAIEGAGQHGCRITTVELNSNDLEVDIIEALAQASAEASAVFVVGLDNLLTDLLGRAQRAPALVNLNLRRDELPERVHARVVLWVEKRCYPLLAKLAWDLLDVTLTRFEFSTIEPIRVLPPSKPELPRLEFVGRVAVPELLSAAHEWLAQADRVKWLPAAEAEAITTSALLFLATGELERGEQLLERAIAAHTRGRNLSTVANLRLRLGSLLLQQGERSLAEAEACEAVALARTISDPSLELSALELLADVHRASGDVESAEHVLKQLVERSEAVNERSKVAAGLAKLGSLAPEQAHEERERDLERAAALFAELGDEFGHAIARRNLADRRMAQGRVVEAYDIYVEEAVAPLLPFPTMDRHIFLASVCWRLARIHTAQGNLDRAILLLDLATTLAGPELGPELEADLAQVRVQLASAEA